MLGGKKKRFGQIAFKRAYMHRSLRMILLYGRCNPFIHCMENMKLEPKENKKSSESQVKISSFLRIERSEVVRFGIDPEYISNFSEVFRKIHNNKIKWKTNNNIY